MAGELGHPCGNPWRGRRGTGFRPEAHNRSSRPQPPRTTCAASSPPRANTRLRRGGHSTESYAF
eukprot:10979128-Prorocentrum_lima.AAC.1